MGAIRKLSIDDDLDLGQPREHRRIVLHQSSSRANATVDGWPLDHVRLRVQRLVLVKPTRSRNNAGLLCVVSCFTEALHGPQYVVAAYSCFEFA